MEEKRSATEFCVSKNADQKNVTRIEGGTTLAANVKWYSTHTHNYFL